MKLALRNQATREAVNVCGMVRLMVDSEDFVSHA